MRRLWRISNHADLEGLGGLRAPGRWHRAGQAVVYTSEQPATALLETLVHLEVESLEELPVSYQLLEIAVPKGLRMPSVAGLPPDWVERPPLTRDLGTRWLAERKHVALRVPSALAVQSFNVLLNPALLPGSGLEIIAAARHPFDARLFKTVRPRRR